MRNTFKALINKFLLLTFVCCYQSASGNIYFRHLGKNDGLSQLSVVSICQDELGRMWFGTLEGLNCYDGTRITSFKYSGNNPLLGNETFNMVSDNKGSLFFTSDKNLFHFDIHKEKFTLLHQQKVKTLFAHKKQVWMVTNDSIFKWNSSKHQFTFFLSHASVHSINNLNIDQKGRLWVSTKHGLFRFDDMKKDSSPICIIPQASINTLYNDSHNNMWAAGFRDGMYKIAADNTIIKYISNGLNSLSANDVRSFVEDNIGNLWIATFNGLNKLDTKGNFSYYTKDDLLGSLKHSSIFPLYKDVQGTIWLGTFYGGVQYFNPETDLFNHYSENINREDCLSFFFIGKMVEDKRGDIWICTDGGGLNKFDRRTQRFTHYLAKGKPNDIPFNNLKGITYDEKRDRLYVGTHTKGFFSFDIQTQKITCYKASDKIGSSITHIAMHDDQLYFSSNRGLFTMNLNTEEITSFSSNKELNQQVDFFMIDSKNDMWIAQFDKLFRISLKNTKEIHRYEYEKKGLGKFPIMRIIEDKEGTLFLGSNGSGLFQYDRTHDAFIRYSTENGWAQSDYCYDMALSQQGHLVISGDQGITFFNPKLKRTKLVDLRNNLRLSALNEGCGLLVCRNGEVFVGGTNGMTSFHENKLFVPAPSYNLYFSSIAINNELIHPDEEGILEKALPFSPKIELKHNENSIIITYTSNNYIGNLQHSDYEYKLEGFDKAWITSADQKIVYTNLNPGTYTLIIREKKTNDDAQSIRLQLIIHSPWYATWLAFICYVLILLSISYAIIRNKYSKMQLKLSLENERREKEKNEEVTQAKLQFFANISHEFRTPLTLIISQIEILLQSKGLSLSLYTRLLKVYRNTFQLKELISELLDFRKIEQGGMKLKVSQMNLIPFLKSIHQEFRERAILQEISFHFTSSSEELMGWYDAKQLKRILLNLLSNAFKHTSKQGKIDLTIEEKDNYIIIKVIDTGQGIAEEDLPHIFDRFYQASSSISKESGTGIGLALTKGLIEMHHGKIEVRSALEYGSIFTIQLSKENVFKNDEHIIVIDSDEQIQRESIPLSSINETETSIKNELEVVDESNKPSVLVVEDNEELLQILTDLLSPLYKVTIAFNGKEGLEKALEEHPDLILSDVMMPIMSGTELCLKIKNNFDLCHIPVILLTALTSENKNLEGLQCGADDYIGKPFNSKILISKIAGMLRNRHLLKKRYSDIVEPTTNHNQQNLALNAIDQKFLTKLNQVIEDHLSDPNFDIALMAKEIGVSRSSLFNKLKALTCMTPNEFVLNTKLKHSADMLKNCPRQSITEIADLLGFSSPRYFRHCFKAQFNKTPQEYRNASSPATQASDDNEIKE